MVAGRKAKYGRGLQAGSVCSVCKMWGACGRGQACKAGMLKQEGRWQAVACRFRLFACVNGGKVGAGRAGGEGQLRYGRRQLLRANASHFRAPRRRYAAAKERCSSAPRERACFVISGYMA